MIYYLFKLFFVIGILNNFSQGYMLLRIVNNKKYFTKFRKNGLLQMVATEDDSKMQSKIKVRFINTIKGRDITAEVFPGDNLLAVGDMSDVKLPRACRTGLCGSCTTQLKDPAAIKTATNPRDGFATIRACSTKCFVPQGETEMIIDVSMMRDRMMTKGGATKESIGSASANNENTDYVISYMI